MTEDTAIDVAPTGLDDDVARIARILSDAFDADNHDSLDADITRLMLDLSAEMDQDGLSRRSRGDERLRTVLKAVLMALRRGGTLSGR